MYISNTSGFLEIKKIPIYQHVNCSLLVGGWTAGCFVFILSTFLYFLFFFFFIFLGPHLWYMEVPRLGVESELQLPAYTTAKAKATATATPDPSHICDLYHSYSNVGSLTQRARLGIKPTASWELSHENFPPLFFCHFAISWAAPVAYGGSQARGLIGAIATGLHQSHSNARSELSL